MSRKFYTIFILPHAHARFRKLHLSRNFLLTVLGIVALAVGAAGITPHLVLRLRAQAAYLEHDVATSCRDYTDAYNAYRAGGDVGGAIRCARNLASLHIVILGEPAVGAGWLGRAQTLLGMQPGEPLRSVQDYLEGLQAST